MTAYAYTEQPFVRPPELDGGKTEAPVAIVGAGPIGLAMAIDLAQRGVASVLFDDNNVVSVGSRAICWAKRTLEIFDRLGVGERMLEKGVTWKVGRNFHGTEQVYAFDLLPEDGHKYPAFVNLQQYYVEDFLLDRAREFPDLIDIRFLSKVTDHEDRGGGRSPDGRDAGRTIHARRRLHAGLRRREFSDADAHGPRFQRSDLRGAVPHLRYREWSKAPSATATRRNAGSGSTRRSTRASRRCCTSSRTNIYRIDLQLDAQADPEAEGTEDRVLPRIRAIVGDKPFRIDWLSVYRFRCMMLERFVHGRVIFAGDSAHVVSPFGARGGNGGIQDVDNLGWKLAAVVTGQAQRALIDSYDEERRHGAAENILNSARATGFNDAEIPDRGAVPVRDAAHGPRPAFRAGTDQFRAAVPALFAGGVPASDRQRVGPCAPGHGRHRRTRRRHMADLAGARRLHARGVRRCAPAGCGGCAPNRDRPADG